MNLSGSNITESQFLAATNVYGVDLSDTAFTGANLAGADLEYVNLSSRRPT